MPKPVAKPTPKSETPASYLEAFTIVERESQGETKSFWVRVGVAFTNRDGSINVFLDALPVNGKLQLRVPLPKSAD
jgi:hypothetical protein